MMGLSSAAQAAAGRVNKATIGVYFASCASEDPQHVQRKCRNPLIRPNLATVWMISALLIHEVGVEAVLQVLSALGMGRAAPRCIQRALVATLLARCSSFLLSMLCELGCRLHPSPTPRDYREAEAHKVRLMDVTRANVHPWCPHLFAPCCRARRQALLRCLRTENM